MIETLVWIINLFIQTNTIEICAKRHIRTLRMWATEANTRYRALQEKILKLPFKRIFVFIFIL